MTEEEKLLIISCIRERMIRNRDTYSRTENKVIISELKKQNKILDKINEKLI